MNESTCGIFSPCVMCILVISRFMDIDRAVSLFLTLSTFLEAVL